MDSHWLPLQSIPHEGRAFRTDDQSFWQGLLAEFGLDVRIVEPIDAIVHVFPQSRGVLFRGRIRGRVSMPCDRCSGESLIGLDHAFDSFEPFPREEAGLSAAGAGDARKEAFDDVDTAVIRMSAHGKGVEINPATLAWEEFSLALPVKPLCGQDCKGLCPACGSNKNAEACSCGSGGDDPRLAPLRGIVIHKK